MMDRRALLRAGAGLAGGALLPGCAAWPGGVGGTPTGLQLTAPRLGAHRVIGQVAGARPFRPQGFRVAVERFADKTVIHNYGHGGCGITLSWGTARLALAHALRQPTRHAAVLGCGAVGLATARLFQDHGFNVRIYARELPPHTVSDIAGGLFAPSYLLDPAFENPDFGAKLATATRYAHDHFRRLAPQRYGLRWMPLYMLSPRTTMPLSWSWAQTPELFRAYAHPAGSHPFGERYAHEYTVLMIEPATYLPALMRDLRDAGGQIHVRHLPDRRAVSALDEPLIVNCTGFGAGALFGDADLVPVKGDLVISAPEPEIDYAVIEAGTGLYMFPRRDGLQLGGTAERGNAGTQPDLAAGARLLADHQRLFDF